MNLFFFFNDTATTEIYTLSLHDALPISHGRAGQGGDRVRLSVCGEENHDGERARPDLRHSTDACHRRFRDPGDRKSTRLNSSHSQISYAVFCLKKKNTIRSTSCNQNDTS